LLKSAREYLAENGLPEEIKDITQEQAVAFSFLHNEFIKTYPVISNHICWHQIYGSGGTEGVGSGEVFLQFHRSMMKDVMNFLEVPNLPIWGSTTSASIVANSLPVPSNAPLDVFFPNETVGFRDYLTRRGGGEVLVVNNVSGETRNITNLNDLRSIDELGRVMGVMYHGIGHFLLGGTMLSFESPRDPQFYVWHSTLDGIADSWLNTSSGKSWSNESLSQDWRKFEDMVSSAHANGSKFTSYCNASELGNLLSFNASNGNGSNIISSSQMINFGLPILGAVAGVIAFAACIRGINKKSKSATRMTPEAAEEFQIELVEVGGARRDLSEVEEVTRSFNNNPLTNVASPRAHDLEGNRSNSTTRTI
jgi:hypothetical protein